MILLCYVKCNAHQHAKFSVPIIPICCIQSVLKYYVRKEMLPGTIDLQYIYCKMASAVDLFH